MLRSFAGTELAISFAGIDGQLSSCRPMMLRMVIADARHVDDWKRRKSIGNVMDEFGIEVR